MTLNRVGVFTVALAAALVTEAAAQNFRPTLNVSSQGRSVTIEWSAVDGALGYNLHVGTATGASDVAAVNLPNSIRRIVVTAPVGRYFLRVRGITLTVLGPYSAEASVTVSDQAAPAPTPNPTPNPSPGPGCQQPAAPSPSANVGGDQSVTISWNGVADATGYRVEFGRSSGSTDLVQNVPGHQTSFRQPVGMAGTFYARVVAGNACGSTTSRTIAFTIEGSTPGGPGPTGSGPRTPNPSTGRLPLPSYGPAVAEAMANTYRGELRNSCVEHGGNNTWMFRVVNELRKRDSRWGLNWKRGRTGDLSQDIVTYNYGSNADEGTIDVYIIDIISGHCGGSPDWNFQDQTEATRSGGGIGRWTLQPYLRAGFPGDARE